MDGIKYKVRNIFYGWWVVAACFLISLFAGGLVILGFTAFFEPIVQEFGWSYAAVSLAASLRGAETGILAPLLGFLVDRWGPRRILVGGIIIGGLGLVILSQISSLGMFYIGFVLVATGLSCVSPTVVYTAVNNWFREKSGMAIGIMISGFSFGGLLVPVVVKIIDIFQWRIAFLLLGLIMWLIVLPLSFLVKNKPRDVDFNGGQGKSTQRNDEISLKVVAPQKRGEVKQALCTRAFWHIGVAIAIQYLAISAMIVHVMPYLSVVGIMRMDASFVATAFPLVSIIGRLGSGWFWDKYDKKMIAIVFFILSGLGQLLFSFVSNQYFGLIVPSVLLFGIGWGGNAVIRAGLVSEYFGRCNYGTILGLIMGIAAIGSILGPYLVGWMFDTWQNYQIAWLVCTGLIAIATIIMAATPQKT